MKQLRYITAYNFHRIKNRCDRYLRDSEDPRSATPPGYADDDRPPASGLIARRWQRFLKEHAGEVALYRKIFIGRLHRRPDFLLSRWLFLRSLGLIYGIAFVSLWQQLDGLVGSNGIFPVKPYLDAVYDKLGIVGYWTFPTLCWVNSGDAFLHGICGAGVLFSSLVVVGVLPVPSLICLWILYLSLSTVTRTFLGYQWDILLLEIGFLAIFLAPGQVLPRFSRERQPSRIIIWLFRWLLFRLMLSSGIVKLNSGDMSWRNLTALNYHYETQPIPNLIAWYAHQLPEWFQKSSVAGTFVIEIALPFLIFAPRRLRFIACFGILSLMALIILTGNYCFFNLLTIALCLLLLDDEILKWFLPKRLFPITRSTRPPSATSFVCSVIAASLVIPLSIIAMKPRVFKLELTAMEQRLYRWAAPYRTVNSYGLFADMTESRPEIIVQGSNDRRNWRDYEFRWKPGDLTRPPSQAAPHQPRIDWQMWFEALNYLRGQQPTEWFRAFLVSLLKGQIAVTELLQVNPFPETPPKYIRATVYDYKFTDFAERKKDGNWWKREYLSTYVYPSALPNNTVSSN